MRYNLLFTLTELVDDPFSLINNKSSITERITEAPGCRDRVPPELAAHRSIASITGRLL